MRIIQICDSVAYGDGVGNDILSKAELFSELGYKNAIYGKHIDPRIVAAMPISELKIRPSDIVIHHYAGLTDLVEFIEKQKCTKILMYHNVTPPELVELDMRKGCMKSITQVKALGGIYDHYIGDSEFNVECLKSLGATSSGEVLPIMVEFDKSRVNRRLKTPKSPVRFLFVGRVVGNKRHEDIINIFNYYNQNINQNSQLYLPGSHETSPKYYRKIRKLVENLPSKDKIYLPGKISNKELIELYNGADVYLSMSQHEGFGIPLLEAMSFQIPVFAFDAAAVKETLGDGGILLDTNDPEIVANKINEITSNENYQKEILERQNKQLELFERESIKLKIEQLLLIWKETFIEMMEENILYGCLIDDEDEIEKNELLIKKMEEEQCNYAYRHLHSDKKYIGKLIIFMKKVVRKLLKWYIEPFCFQQTEFNRATTMSMKYILEKLEEIEDKDNTIKVLLEKIRERETLQ